MEAVNIFGPTPEDVVIALENFCVGCLTPNKDVDDEHLCFNCGGAVMPQEGEDNVSMTYEPIL